MQPIRQEEQENEKEYANSLYIKKILPGPGTCSCNSSNFTIQMDNSNKTSKCCFRCNNYLCRKKFPIRINSLYQEFPFFKLKDITEILKCFLCLELNAEKALKLLKDEMYINISKRSLLKIYQVFRNIIYKYMHLVYETENIGDANKNEFYSADESLITHHNNKQIWLLGVINNTTKNFRIIGSFNRDASTLSRFIKKFVRTGNQIVTDSWGGYNWIDSAESGYQHIKYNHGLGLFGSGLQSTSHMEAVWNIIKSKIKNTYYHIPGNKIFRYVRETEYKYNINNKNFDDKLLDFLEVYALINSVTDEEFKKKDFLNDSDLDSDNEEENEDSIASD